jgi:dTDP-4-dehydrorhamnose 3,5-epimerase
MGTINPGGIILTPLPIIETIGGDVMHAMKMSDIGYAGFGEAYFSWVSEGVVKAWKKHKRMTMNLVVPVGQVRFVFRVPNSFGVEEFHIEEIGTKRYARVTVPPGIWFGFKGLSKSQSLVLNIANIPHDPCEVERQDQSSSNYIWM